MPPCPQQVWVPWFKTNVIHQKSGHSKPSKSRTAPLHRPISTTMSHDWPRLPVIDQGNPPVTAATSSIAAGPSNSFRKTPSSSVSVTWEMCHGSPGVMTLRITLQGNIKRNNFMDIHGHSWIFMEYVTNICDTKEARARFECEVWGAWMLKTEWPQRRHQIAMNQPCPDHMSLHLFNSQTPRCLQFTNL